GFDGGGEWGGAAFDPETGVLYVNSNEMPWILTMVDIEQEKSQMRSLGAETYSVNCGVCHGPDRKGDSQNTYPPLTGLSQRYTASDLMAVVENGKGFMPGFAFIPDAEKKALVGFLLDSEEASAGGEAEEDGSPRSLYSHTGYNRFLDPEGYPAVEPPWGTLNAIDLNSGRYRWKRTLGEFKELTESGIPPTGTENYGGGVVTRGGLLFIAATKDEKFRAFDKDTGALLWEADLPAGGYATPSTYSVNGKQFIVIAAGGGKMGTKSGDAYLAFSLNDAAGSE
ncbi:MAG: c-type cytochrome, partial [Acidobacteriota bacterium]